MLKIDEKGRPSSARPEPPIPVLDLRAQYAGLRGEVLRALHEVADSTTYILGPRVAEFEEAFAAYTAPGIASASTAGPRPSTSP